ncbi:hypothetical protein ONZ45_g19605 [Pleurotus djamor]|nr:hypothetical protein ONZ45_g19605 [Pleurotus djamor]
MATTTPPPYIKHCLRTAVNLVGNIYGSHTLPLAAMVSQTFAAPARATFTASRTRVIVDRPRHWQSKVAYEIGCAAYQCLKYLGFGHQPLRDHYKYTLVNTVFSTRHFLSYLCASLNRDGSVAVLTFDEEFKKYLERMGPSRFKAVKENVQANGFMLVVYHIFKKPELQIHARRWLIRLFLPFVEAIYRASDIDDALVTSISDRKLIEYMPARGLGQVLDAAPEGATSVEETFKRPPAAASTPPLQDTPTLQASNSA